MVMSYEVVEVPKHGYWKVLRFEGDKQACEDYVRNNWFSIKDVYLGHSDLIIRKLGRCE